MKMRTAVTNALWIKLGISAVAAALLTLVAVSMTWGGMAPGHGKATFYGALIVLPLALGANFEWSRTASTLFALLTYFALSMVIVLALAREK